MQKIKKILKIALIIIGILVIGIGIFIYSLKPDYNGEKQFSGLEEEVKVYYDTYGIPHIYAANKIDAFKALGYVHAQDRLWQMELLRRIAPGELAEIFGEEALPNDKLFIAMGIDDASVKTVANIDKNSKEMLLSQAYLDGINKFIDEGPTPIEFYLTGVEKRPFVLKDIYNTIGYMAFSFAMAQKTDPLVTTIYEKLGEEYLKDLEIGANPNTLRIKNYNNTVDSTLNTLTAKLGNTLKDQPFPLFVGSNSWVLSPEKTKNGKVILANDPHIGFAQPSVWYEAHVHTPDYEMYGYHMAGVPFPVMGHNKKMAYGVTMFENDDVDFYYEENHPSDATKYKTENGWESYQTISKTIKVKGLEDVIFTYNKTRHGPVLNGLFEEISMEQPVAMRWIYTNWENKLVNVLNGISSSESLDEFKGYLPDFHAPGLNIMYGDAKGNVAWWATAKLYQMPDSTNTKMILDGSSGTQEPKEHLDFSKNPQAINPPWNYVYSANNQPDSVAGKLYPGYYLPENRAKRIVELLEPKNDWDLESVSNMSTDITSAVNPSIVTDIAKLLDVTELTDEQIALLDKLNNWKGDYPLTSIEATIFHRWMSFILSATFKDELGETLYTQWLSTHFHKRTIAPFMSKDTSVWWDDVVTKDKKETQQDIVQTAFLKTLQSLEEDFGGNPNNWTWDKVHTLEHAHPIGRVSALRSLFNVGPFPVHSSREVINNMDFLYDDSGKHNVITGPSTRRIIDFSDIENSISILPTGQSGNPFSKHYDDQSEMYVNGEFRKMMMNKEEIIEKSKSILTFTKE